MALYDKQHRGFVKAMARELLVHNPNINSVDDALALAEELLGKTIHVSDTHTLSEDNGLGRSE